MTRPFNFVQIGFISVLIFYYLSLDSTSSTSCGLVSATNNVKIVGGVVATQGSWPSIAYIRWGYKANYKLPTGVIVTFTSGYISCDGTLISTRKILTAGE